MTGLDDVLKEPEEKQKEEVVVEEAKGPPRDESGRFAKQDEVKEEPKEEKKPEAEAKPEPKPEPKEEKKVERQEMSEKERAFLAAAQEERRKRQELERRIQEIEASKTKETPKQFWDNPEEALAKFKAEITEATTRTRLDTAEMIARRQYPDFDEKVQTFGQLVNSVPGLAQQWLSSPDPAEFAYKVAKNHMEVQAVGGLDQLMAKKEAEIRARLEAELREKYDKAALEAAKQREQLPGSLSNTRGVSQNKPVWTGPTPLGSLLEGK